LRVGKVIAKKAVCSFFGPPCRPYPLWQRFRPHKLQR